MLLRGKSGVTSRIWRPQLSRTQGDRHLTAALPRSTLNPAFQVPIVRNVTAVRLNLTSASVSTVSLSAKPVVISLTPGQGRGGGWASCSRNVPYKAARASHCAPRPCSQPLATTPPAPTITSRAAGPFPGFHHSSSTPLQTDENTGRACVPVTLFICLHIPSSAYSCCCRGLDQLPVISEGKFLPGAGLWSSVVLGN